MRAESPRMTDSSSERRSDSTANMRSAFDVRVKIADFLFEGLRYRSVIPIATV